MPRPILYTLELSPPCRAVLLTAKAIDLDLELREINLITRDHMKDEFIKLNPQHTIPTLDDDGFILWDSHAIMRYLVGKYAKNDKLYPNDLQIRALIDQRLHFEGEMIFVRLRNTAKPLFFDGEKSIPMMKLQQIEEALVIFNKFLDGQQWLAGDSYTLADISCVSSVASLQAFTSLDKYANIAAWLKRCEDELPGYEEACGNGVKAFCAAIKQIVQKSNIY